MTHTTIERGGQRHEAREIADAHIAQLCDPQQRRRALALRAPRAIVPVCMMVGHAGVDDDQLRVGG